MRPFLDSSVLVAAFDSADEFHAWALPLARLPRAAIAAHSLAETFSTLTGRRHWTPADAARAIRHNTAGMEKVTLTAKDILTVLDGSQAIGVRGGAVYDCLILACARKLKGGVKIYTANPGHFRLFAPDLKNSIFAPPSISG